VEISRESSPIPSLQLGTTPEKPAGIDTAILDPTQSDVSSVTEVHLQITVERVCREMPFQPEQGTGDVPWPTARIYITFLNGLLLRKSLALPENAPQIPEADRHTLIQSVSRDPFRSDRKNTSKKTPLPVVPHRLLTGFSIVQEVVDSELT
jgi:hypothetical protein